MARFKVHHSEDACCIDIRGDVKNPEPSTAVVKFPGGHVEVSRHSDGSYWIHVERNVERDNEDEDLLGEIVESRIDYTHDAYTRRGGCVDPMPAAEDIQHMAIRIARATA
jgi:hypothetical protein